MFRYIAKREYNEHTTYTFEIPEGRLTIKRSDVDCIMILRADNVSKVVFREDLSPESVTFVNQWHRGLKHNARISKKDY